MRPVRRRRSPVGLGLLLGTCLRCGPAPQPVASVPPPGSFAVARQPYSLRLGDVDGDGVADVLAASLEEDCLTLLGGGPPGHPAWRLDLGTGGPTVATAVGDVDGDGRPDLLGAVRSAPGRLAVFLGRPGNRPFRSAHVDLDGIPNDLDAADLDGDGRDEVVVALRAESVALVRHAGGRPQVEQIPLPGCGGQSSYGPDGVTLADWDGDGARDLAVACYGAWSVLVLAGRPGGSLGPPRQVASVPPGELDRIRGALDPDPDNADPALGGLRKVRLADLDGDRRTDLAAIGDWGVLLLVFGGDTVTSRVVATGVDGSNDLAPGDIDGDGRPEILLTSGHEDRIVLLRSPAWRDGAVSVGYAGTAPSTPESLVLRDLDRDGAADLALAGQRGHAVQLLRGAGDGTFAPFPPAPGAAP